MLTTLHRPATRPRCTHRYTGGSTVGGQPRQSQSIVGPKALLSPPPTFKADIALKTVFGRANATVFIDWPVLAPPLLIGWIRPVHRYPTTAAVATSRFPVTQQVTVRRQTREERRAMHHRERASSGGLPRHLASETVSQPPVRNRGVNISLKSGYSTEPVLHEVELFFYF